VFASFVSFDCSRNSRGWQAKQGVVAAIAQETVKIIDVVQKFSYCQECKIKQSDRDDKRISTLDYLEWFLKHEVDCSLNHTGSPQVYNNLKSAVFKTNVISNLYCSQKSPIKSLFLLWLLLKTKYFYRQWKKRQ